MKNMLRTVLRAIKSKVSSVQANLQYEAQRKATDAMVADLDAIVANMKRAREDVELRAQARCSTSPEVGGKPANAQIDGARDNHSSTPWHAAR